MITGRVNYYTDMRAFSRGGLVGGRVKMLNCIDVFDAV